MLAGQMDYTPGAFLNVTKSSMTNTNHCLEYRAAELSKFSL